MLLSNQKERDDDAGGTYCHAVREFEDSLADVLTENKGELAHRRRLFNARMKLQAHAQR